MKTIVLFLSFLLVSFSFSQEKKPTVTIKTNSECGDCKDRIEGKLNYTKGIIFAELDYKTKILTVKYNSKKITLDQIKKIVSEIGYDADEVKAVESAQKALPLCCQPGGMAK
jgi:periplasmic mercuric ion binding protein